MTTQGPRIIWTGVVAAATYRLVDLGAPASPRLVLELESPPDAMGGVGWSRINLPLADVLEAALFDLLAQR